MNTHRTLGLLAALVVTAAQATVLAVDSRGPARSEPSASHYDARLATGTHAQAQLAYSAAREAVGA